MTDWNELISDVVAGHWKDPATAKTATVPFEVIRIEDDLDGGEADMLAPLKLGKRIAVVSDVNTHEAMGRRVAKHLKGLGTIEELVLPGNTHCDEPTIAMVQEKTRHADAIVGDFQAIDAAVHQAHPDAAGAGIQCVFNQFLGGTGRPLHHLAGGDAVDQGFGQAANRHRPVLRAVERTVMPRPFHFGLHPCKKRHSGPKAAD